MARRFWGLAGEGIPTQQLRRLATTPRRGGKLLATTLPRRSSFRKTNSKTSTSSTFVNASGSWLNQPFRFSFFRKSIFLPRCRRRKRQLRRPAASAVP